jgi:hypothetical protein
MCRTYNTIGSLTTIKSELYSSKIYDFKSLKEVMDFQSSYTAIRQQVLTDHEKLIEQEKNTLLTDVQQLEKEIETQKQQAEQRLSDEIESLKQKLSSSINNPPKNIFQQLANWLREKNYKKLIQQKEANYAYAITMSISNLVNNYQAKSSRYQFIATNADEAVRQSAHYSLTELQRKKTKIDKLNSFIYGALGEQKVVKTLEALSDEYHLINDFSVSFYPAIYNRQENEYIKSVQIDHILVGPSGVFLIETKNWSEKSLESLNLRSPILQIKRTSFALFKLLNNNTGRFHLSLESHHWGERKLSIRNLLVLTNTKPKEEFKYVTILTVQELLGYITNLKPALSNNEVQRIVEYMLRLNEKRVIKTK